MKSNHNQIKQSKRSFSVKLRLLTIAFFLFALAVSAQTQKVTLNAKDTTLESVINSIRKQTDINIIYSNDEVKEKSAKVYEHIFNLYHHSDQNFLSQTLNT